MTVTSVWFVFHRAGQSTQEFPAFKASQGPDLLQCNQLYSGGISNTHSKKILLHKITASPWEQGVESCTTHTHIHISLCTCKRINLLGEPGSGLLLCWGKVSAGAGFLLHAKAPRYKLISGCKKVFFERWSY